MRRALGALLVLAAVIGVAVGGLWSFMKASGAEVDICSGGGPNCTSGWYYAAPILVGAIVSGVIGVALLRGEGNRSRPRTRG